MDKYNYSISDAHSMAVAYALNVLDAGIQLMKRGNDSEFKSFFVTKDETRPEDSQFVVPDCDSFIDAPVPNPNNPANPMTVKRKQ